MILFIDTSKEQVKIALYDKAEFLAEKVWLSAKNQSEELLSEIDKLLKAQGIGLRNIEKILVATGPGSHTGLRVGLSTANSLAMSLNIEIDGIDSGQEARALKQKFAGKRIRFAGAVMPTYLLQPKITKPKPRR